MTATEARTIPDLMAEYDYIESCEDAALVSAQALTDQKLEVKARIGELMDREGHSSLTDQATGRKAYFRENRTHVIDDAGQVRQYLAAIGELDGCLKLDAAAVKKLMKQHTIPGMKEQVTQSFTVTKKGDK